MCSPPPSLASDASLVADLIAEHSIEAVVSSVMPDLRTAPAPAYQASNVDGVRTLLSCAKEAASVHSFVHISSIAVTNHHIPSHAASEQEPLPPPETYASLYDATKRVGEDLVLGAQGEGGVQTIALRPGGILAGPDAVAVKEAFAMDPIQFIPEEAEIDYCHGIDVAHAVGCALSKLHGDEVGVRLLSPRAF